MVMWLGNRPRSSRGSKNNLWASHATRVLIAATRRNGVLHKGKRITTVSANAKVHDGEVAIASTRVACAPQKSLRAFFVGGGDALQRCEGFPCEMQ
jgi:hypothetical protein